MSVQDVPELEELEFVGRELESAEELITLDDVLEGSDMVYRISSSVRT